MGNLNKIVYLTEAQLATLIHDGSITVGGQTVTYNANDIYMTPGTASLPRDISELTALPGSPASSDLLAIRNGSDTYKVTYQTLASNAIKEWTQEVSSVSISTSGTTVTLGYPTGYVSGTNRILAVFLELAWPLQNWNNGAVVIINNSHDYINGTTDAVYLTTTSTQTYRLIFKVLWI